MLLYFKIKKATSDGKWLFFIFQIPFPSTLRNNDVNNNNDRNDIGIAIH
ncbi:MAG: hypothetical protein ACI8P3_004563 [Saprospiraceae bacterium]|jgi:hypothetical protein